MRRDLIDGLKTRRRRKLWRHHLTPRTSSTLEPSIAGRLRNAAGLADWETFNGGGDCLVRVIDGVPSFLTVATSETNFAVTIRRDDASICFTDASPSPGETPT